MLAYQHLADLTYHRRAELLRETEGARILRRAHEGEAERRDAGAAGDGRGRRIAWFPWAPGRPRGAAA